jgi:3-dehydro-4-phosphotetronate decarboxylase
VPLSSVGPDDYAVVQRDGTVLSGVPSKELSAHRALYDAQPEVRAVLHVHGVYMAAYSCVVAAGDDDYPAVGAACPLKVSDRLPVIPYSHTNIRGDYERFLEGARRAPVFLQRNHGVFVGAPSVADALTIATMLEANFQVFFVAASSGRPMTVLSPEEKATLCNRSYPTNLHSRYITE